MLAGAPASANGGTIVANGATQTATVSTAGQASSWTFSGTAGEVVTASAYDGTFAGSCDVNLLLLDPSGNQLGSAGCAGTSGFLGETTLPYTGTYTLKLSPTNNDLGSVTLSLSENAATATETENTPFTFTSSHTGQGQEFAFKGKSNQTVTLSAYNGTFANGCDIEIYILDANGNNLGGTGCASPTSFIANAKLAGKGMYYVDVVPLDEAVGSNTGSLTILVASAAAAGTITADGSPVTFTAAVSGEGGSYTFSGTSGEVVTATTYDGTFSNGCALDIYLLGPTGQTLNSGGCSAQQSFVPETTLPGAGTYTLELYPLAESIGSDTGTVRVALSADPAAAAITENGPAVTFMASHTGQGGNFTFKGKAGQVVTVSTYGGTFPGSCDVQVLLLSSTGQTLGDGGCASQTGFLGETTLPSKGTYTIELLAQGNNIGSSTGSVSVSLSEDAAAGTLSENGPAATFTTTHIGQGQDYTFSGTAGDTVTVTTSGGTFPNGCDLTLYLANATGISIGPGGGCAAQSGTLSATLPGTGTYTVELVPTSNNPGTNQGSVTVDVTT